MASSTTQATKMRIHGVRFMFSSRRVGASLQVCVIRRSTTLAVAAELLFKCARDRRVRRACVRVCERERVARRSVPLPPGTAAAVTPTGRGFRRALVLSPSYIMCVCVRRKKRREREKHERRAMAVTVSFLGRAPSALHHCSSTSEGHLRIPTNGQSGVSYFQLGIRAQVTLISFYRSF